jgi:hypothetical protein
LSLTLVAIGSSRLNGQGGGNFIFQLSGDVRIIKAETNREGKAYIGSILKPSDRLKLGRNAVVIVRCSDGEKWEVPPGKISQVSVGCPSSTRTGVPDPNRDSPAAR